MQMIDCMPGSYGCQGGDICGLLSWLLASKTRIILETDYPLTWQTDMCRLSKYVTYKFNCEDVSLTKMLQDLIFQNFCEDIGS